MERLFDRFPLGAQNFSASMTINGPAPIILAMYVAAARRRFGPKVTGKLRGTVQADILKEVQAQNEIIFPLEASLRFLTDMVDGRLPQPPICATLGFHLAKVADGYARFDGVPEFRHYNPIGTVHGGFAATLLDSALGCAIFSTLGKGDAWTTLELKLNFVRAMSKDTGPVRAEGRIIHRGRTVATSEGDLKDGAGKLYAHATTTCMIFPANS
jgi:uncharacterized protein (TIGR00369 family)